MHPEDRRADQQVAQRAAAHAGDGAEEGEGDQVMPLLRRRQGARGCGELAAPSGPLRAPRTSIGAEGEDDDDSCTRLYEAYPQPHPDRRSQGDGEVPAEVASQVTPRRAHRSAGE